MFVKSPKVFAILNKLINFKKSDEPIKSDSTSLGLNEAMGVTKLTSERIGKVDFSGASIAVGDVKINGFDALASAFATDFEVGVIREGKVITMGNVTDMEKFQEIMTSEKMKAWDAKHNCVDVVYSLEKQ